jgi:hypothetical protein
MKHDFDQSVSMFTVEGVGCLSISVASLIVYGQ